MQDLRAKVIISESFQIAAMERTLIKIGKICINGKAHCMDMRTSVVDEIVKNGCDI